MKHKRKTRTRHTLSRMAGEHSVRAAKRRSQKRVTLDDELRALQRVCCNEHGKAAVARCESCTKALCQVCVCEMRDNATGTVAKLCPDCCDRRVERLYSAGKSVTLLGRGAA